MAAMTKTSTRTSDAVPRKTHKKSGFFSKIKKVFNGSTDSLMPIRSRDDDRESSLGLGTIATRTRSRRSVFGSSKDTRDADAERELEERKSRCLAIQAAKRDPPAVQRLLVDCEFCNPPPKFGRIVSIPNAGLDSDSAQRGLTRLEQLRASGADLSDERTWNTGLDQWIRQREHWLAPTADQQPQHMLEPELTADRYYTVFDKMIYQTRPLKHPLNLGEVCKILKAGWVAEGTWVGGSQNDVWSTSEDDEHSPTAANTTINATISGHSGPGSPAGGATPHAGSPSPLGSSPSPVSNGTAAASRGPSPKPAPPQNLPKIHVQFSDRPHPRETSPVISDNFPSLERVQSSTGVPLQPVRSSQSSIISLTDSD